MGFTPKTPLGCSTPCSPSTGCPCSAVGHGDTSGIWGHPWEDGNAGGRMGTLVGEWGHRWDSGDSGGTMGTVVGGWDHGGKMRAAFSGWGHWWNDGDNSGRLETQLFPGCEHPMDPPVMSPPEGPQGEGRGCWWGMGGRTGHIHPCHGCTMCLASASPVPAGPHWMRDGDTAW